MGGDIRQSISAAAIFWILVGVIRGKIRPSFYLGFHLQLNALRLCAETVYMNPIADFIRFRQPNDVFNIIMKNR